MYKGISTYDYIKMQRQKEAKTKDLEVEKSNEVKNKAAKVRHFLLILHIQYGHCCV